MTRSAWWMVVELLPADLLDGGGSDVDGALVVSAGSDGVLAAG